MQSQRPNCTGGRSTLHVTGWRVRRNGSLQRAGVTGFEVVLTKPLFPCLPFRVPQRRRSVPFRDGTEGGEDEDFSPRELLSWKNKSVNKAVKLRLKAGRRVLDEFDISVENFLLQQSLAVTLGDGLGSEYVLKLRVTIEGLPEGRNEEDSPSLHQRLCEESAPRVGGPQAEDEEDVADAAEPQTRDEEGVADVAEPQEEDEEDVADAAEPQTRDEEDVADVAEPQTRDEEGVAEQSFELERALLGMHTALIVAVLTLAWLKLLCLSSQVSAVVFGCFLLCLCASGAFTHKIFLLQGSVTTEHSLAIASAHLVVFSFLWEKECLVGAYAPNVIGLIVVMGAMAIAYAVCVCSAVGRRATKKKKRATKPSEGLADLMTDPRRNGRARSFQLLNTWFVVTGLLLLLLKTSEGVDSAVVVVLLLLPLTCVQVGIYDCFSLATPYLHLVFAGLFCVFFAYHATGSLLAYHLEVVIYLFMAAVIRECY